jgi:hypothetical protein
VGVTPTPATNLIKLEGRMKYAETGV